MITAVCKSTALNLLFEIQLKSFQFINNDCTNNDIILISSHFFQFHNQEPDKPEELLEILKFVRPGKGFTPKMDFSTKVDVNGKDESPVFTFLKVSDGTSTHWSEKNCWQITRWKSEPVKCVCDFPRVIQRLYGIFREFKSNFVYRQKVERWRSKG